MTSTITNLTDEQIDELGRELDAIRQRIVDDLGEEDRDYIYNVIKAQRALEVTGRASLMLSALPPFWLAGVAALSLSKILDNMEIGHNVMHGQYDWMRDPALNSKRFEWDTACPSDQWRHSHNYMHHTYTNILDKDRDIGYGILRMDESQKWNPYYLGNPVWAFLLMTFFQYGVALHDLETENVVTGKRKMSENKALWAGIWRKVGKQTLKDYVLFPALERPAVPDHALGQRHGQPGPQPVGLLDHLLRALPERRRDLHRGRDRERVARRLVRAADDGLGQHHRQQAVPHHVRQPVAPDRAPPVPGPAGPPLPADRPRGQGAVREVRPALQHRPVQQADRLDVGQDLPPRRAVRLGRQAGPDPRYGGAAGSGRRVTESGDEVVGNIEIGKDTVQVLAESAAAHVGRIATIVSGAVREVTREIGEWASDVLEMREAAERARSDS